jgi:hypothetical protein
MFISEMNRMCLVLFHMNSTVFGPELAAIHRILISVMAFRGLRALRPPIAHTPHPTPPAPHTAAARCMRTSLSSTGLTRVSLVLFHSNK